MATKMDNSSTSSSDQKFFITMFKYIPNGVSIDWDEFTKDMGFKDVKSAKTRFGQIRRKYAIGQPATNTPRSPSKVTKPKTPRKGRAKKQAAGLDFSDDDEKKAIIKNGSSDDEKNQVIKGDYHEDDNLVKKEVVSDDIA